MFAELLLSLLLSTTANTNIDYENSTQQRPSSPSHSQSQSRSTYNNNNNNTDDCYTADVPDMPSPPTRSPSYVSTTPESQKFILLPVGANHNVAFFPRKTKLTNSNNNSHKPMSQSMEE